MGVGGFWIGGMGEEEDADFAEEGGEDRVLSGALDALSLLGRKKR